MSPTLSVADPAGTSDAIATVVRHAQAGRRVLVLDGSTRDWYQFGGVPLRLPEFLAQVAAQLGLGTVVYRRGMAPEELVVPGAAATSDLRLPREGDPSTVLPALLDLVGPGNSPILLLIDGVENLLPDAESPVSNPEDLDVLDRLQRLPVSPAYSFSESLVVFAEHVAPMHHRLRTSPGIMVHSATPPSAEERRAFLAASELVEPARIDGVVQSTGGLMLDEVRFLAEVAIAEGRTLDADAVAARKADILRTASPNLELLSTTYGLDEVAGVQAIKRWLEDCRRAGRNPRMILLDGPTGVGKTHLARAMAFELKVPVVKVNMQNSPYVGENERQLRETQRRIESMESAVVLIDEVDSRLGSRQGGPQGDSGTSNRLMSEFLEWTGSAIEHPGLTIICTANRADRIDGALMNRLTWVVPVLHPTAADLPALISMVASQIGIRLVDEVDLAAVAQSDRLAVVSGREVAAMLERAALIAAERGSAVDESALREAVGSMPRRSRDEDRFWTFLALQYVSDERLLPWMGVDGFDPAAVPTLARDVVDEYGRLDAEVLTREVATFVQRYGR